MTQHSGYLFTKDPAVALALCGTGGVRYAAELTDGRGFAAFDSERELLYEFGTLGEVLVQADPDYPDSWPEWTRPHAPHKKFASTMDNRFVLYPATGYWSAAEDFRNFVQVHSPKAAALVTAGAFEEFHILIEDGPDWIGPENAIWDCGVVEYRDARILVG